jgi:hypothetical protein
MNLDDISEKLKKMSDEQICSELETAVKCSDYDPLNKVLSEQSHDALAVGRITNHSLEWAKPKHL